MKEVAKLYSKGEKEVPCHLLRILRSILLEMGIWLVIKESHSENLKFPKQVRHSLFSDLVYFLIHKGGFVLGKSKL